MPKRLRAIARATSVIHPGHTSATKEATWNAHTECAPLSAKGPSEGAASVPRGLIQKEVHPYGLFESPVADPVFVYRSLPPELHSSHICLTRMAVFATDCTLCAAGQYSAKGASACSSCPAGTARSTQGTNPGDSTACLKCLGNQYSTTGGQTACQTCPDGSYISKSSNDGNTECSLCPAGQHSAYVPPNPTGCVNCPAGQYSSAGSATCSPCQPGHYQPLVGQAACEACGKGFFQNETGMTGCTLCTAGQYNPNTGAAHCSNCPVGTFSIGAGSADQQFATTACTPCAAGKYSGTVVGQSDCGTCSPCPVGTYQPDTGNDTCIECDPGTSNDTPGRVDSCADCAMNFFQVSIVQGGQKPRWRYWALEPNISLSHFDVPVVPVAT